MKRFLLAGATMLALTAAQPTLAADAPVYKGPAPVAAALFNWSGFYVGGDVGYLWGNANVVIPAVGNELSTYTLSSISPGGHIGYRYQFLNGFVIGIEGDLAWLNASGNAPFNVDPTASSKMNLNWKASVRGTAGWAMNQSLLYVTGGAAWINNPGCGFVTAAGPGTCVANTNFGDTPTGWTLGGGVAVAISRNLIARIEYLYADFGTINYAGTGWVGGTAVVSLRTNEVRFGLSWMFGG